MSIKAKISNLKKWTVKIGVANGGTKDHRKLTNRDAEGQHPMSAITGLVAALQEPKAHAESKTNPHGVTAAQVGARPDTWMPTAAQVGARPSTWMPSASDVGAAYAGYGLGETAWLDEVPDSRGGVGFFALSQGTTNAPVPLCDLMCIDRTPDVSTQIAIDHQNARPDFLIRKKSKNDGWGDWRYVNPKMILNTEYLTNEVWQNKDVFVRVLSAGTMVKPNTFLTLGKDVTPFHISGIAYNGDYVCDLSAYSGVDEVYYRVASGQIVIHSIADDVNNYSAFVVVKYTKN